MNRIVKYALIGAAVGAALGYLGSAYAQYVQPVTPQTIQPIVPYNASPYNFQNSPYNYNNSPYNYNNSPYNYNAPNRVYDSDGRPSGYTTTTPDGVTNIYDFSGQRRGYIPSPNW